MKRMAVYCSLMAVLLFNSSLSHSDDASTASSMTSIFTEPGNPEMHACLTASFDGGTTGVAVKACQAKAATAQMVCGETTSLPIQGFMAAAGGITATIGVVQSVTEACAKQNKIMSLATDAATAFNAICGGAQLWCTSTCTPITTIELSPTATAAANAIITSCNTACDRYTLTLAAAAVGLAQFASSSMGANKCQQSTTTATPTAVAAIGTTSATSANTPVTGVSALPEGVAINSIPSTSGTTAPITDDGSLASTPSSGTGGGSGGGTGLNSGLTTTANVPLPGVPIAAVNDSLKMGADGSVGSSGSGTAAGVAGYGPSEVAAATNKFAKFLPGAQRGVAAVRDISAKAGKSNWDKVRQTYLEQSPKLLDK